MKGPSGKKSMLSRGRQSLGRAFTKIAGSRKQEQRSNSDGKLDEDNNEDEFSGVEMRNLQSSQEPEDVTSLPGSSEPSLLLSEKSRSLLYASLPALVQGRKWLLLYRFALCRNSYDGSCVLFNLILAFTKLVTHCTFSAHGDMGYRFQLCTEEACFGQDSACW